MRKVTTVSNLLDTPLFSVLQIDLERFLYLALAAAAIAACFYNLGVRAQSHDECVHFLYSRELYVGDGFVHDPWRHGPFLYHINALVYFFFGASDFTARISTAMFGVILVLLPVFLRKELGRVGALTVSTLTLISPSTLYYARYIRNDIYMMVWAMLMTVALFRYLGSRNPRWLYLGAVAVTLALCTKETAYITGFIGFAFMALFFLRQMLSAKGMRAAYVLATVLLLLLIVAWIGLNAGVGTVADEGQSAEEPSAVLTQGRMRQIAEVVFLLIGILVAVLLGMTLIQRDERLRPAASLLIAYAAAIAALVAFCALPSGLAWLAIIQLPEGVARPWAFVFLQVMAVGLGACGGAVVWWRALDIARARGWLPVAFEKRVVLVVLVLVTAIFTLLYTTFFTNPRGLISGTVGGVSYWLAQQEVRRAGQPWYYYLIIASLYDFLPVGVGSLGIAYYTITGKASLPAPASRGEPVPTRAAFVAYAVYWALSAWLIYSWAGEKMPWMVVHVVQPMIVLAGRAIDDLVRGVRWRQVWRKGGASLALVTPVLMLALGTMVGTLLIGRAYRDVDDTLRWLSASAVGGGLSVVGWKVTVKIGKHAAWRVVLVTLLALGAVATARFAWLASYVYYDTAKEFLVYAHGTPDIKRTVNELKAISRRLYGDEESIEFAYTTDAAWPFECYFEPSFPNRTFIGTEPTRSNTDVPVLIVGYDEVEKTEPYLGDRYYRFDRKYLWFPHQDYYMNLSLALPSEENRQPGVNYFFLDMQDAEKRRAFWDVLFYRKYQQSLADWEPSNPGKFAFYVRKDIAAQIWNLSAGPYPGDTR